jgi:hypothetical protein
MKNCAHCFRGLTTLTDVVDVRFIARFNLFERTKPCLLRKFRSSNLKYRLDPAAWVLQGKTN